MKRSLYYCFVFFLSITGKAQLVFSSIDSLFLFADNNSSVSKTNYNQQLLAKWTQITAIANTINFRDPVSFTATDNLLLPVSFIPASAFGGPPGSLKQITLGQQYVSNFNFNPQIDIINPANWARVKSASVNKELTEVNSLLAKKNLFESIAASFSNILSLQQQIILLKENLAAADTLVFIAKNKYGLGLIREQDLNNLVVNQLSLSDKLNQSEQNLTQQYNSLKILCDVPPKTTLIIREPLSYRDTKYAMDLSASSSLLLKSNVLQNAYAKSELRANRWSTLPVISAIYYQGWQQNSNSSLFDSKQPWIQSQYIGLRITVPFPPDATRLSQNYTAKINFRLSAINADHARLQNDLNNENLTLDYKKAVTSYDIARQVNELKRSNYEKSLLQYKEGILSTDLMLNAFIDMLNARINMVSSQAAAEYAKNKININNQVK